MVEDWFVAQQSEQHKTVTIFSEQIESRRCIAESESVVAVVVCRVVCCALRVTDLPVRPMRDRRLRRPARFPAWLRKTRSQKQLFLADHHNSTSNGGAVVANFKPTPLVVAEFPTEPAEEDLQCPSEARPRTAARPAPLGCATSPVRIPRNRDMPLDKLPGSRVQLWRSPYRKRDKKCAGKSSSDHSLGATCPGVVRRRRRQTDENARTLIERFERFALEPTSASANLLCGESAEGADASDVPMLNFPGSFHHCSTLSQY